MVDGSIGVGASRSIACAAIRIMGRGGSCTPISSTRTTRSIVAPGAGRCRLCPRARIGNGLPKRVALQPGAVAHIEPHAGDGGRPARGCRVDDDPDAIHVVEPDLDDIARNVRTERLTPVRVVELRLQLVANRPYGIFRHVLALDLS